MAIPSTEDADLTALDRGTWAVARLPMIEAELRRRQVEKQRRTIARDADEIRARCKTFVGFVREAWHVVEPTKPYIYGWHHGAIGAHYEAIARGEIHHLAVNQPPNTSKSVLLSVMAGAYEWGPCGKPGLKFLTTSYKEGYARRDSRAMRDLVMSEWFQMLWPEVVITRDNEVDFANNYHGGRRAVAFASLTSGHGDRVIIDDPHSTETVESDTEREKATRIFRESVPGRGINPATDATIVIMHRLHEKDVCGAIEQYGMNYVRLLLPMEYDPKVVIPSKYFEDPRTEHGELLWPERFDRAYVDDLKGGKLSSHAFATQYQQQPSAREGGMFKRHWFADRFVDAVPTKVRARVRRWDLAASENTGDWTVGILMMMTYDGEFYIEDMIRFRELGATVHKSISMTIEMDRKNGIVHTVIPQDPGAAGKSMAEAIIRENAGSRITAERETGSKATRAEPFAAQCEVKNVWIVRGEWNEALIHELAGFPQTGFDDIVDACAGAFNKLITLKGFVATQEMIAHVQKAGQLQRLRRQLR